MGYGSRNGPPAWFVFLVGVAVVFGLYYLWTGVRSFMASGMTVVESTRQAIDLSTATAVRFEELETFAPTSLPTQTPVPPCQEFIVDVPSAIVRERPSTDSPVVTTLSQNETVCVIAREPETDWYVVDENPLTRRLEAVYMHEDIIRALNPTLTPSNTFTPAPTVTNTPTYTPSASSDATVMPSATQPAVPTLPPTITPTETPASVNL